MHYLDHAATTPMLPEVREAMEPYLSDDFGNASSVHAYGRRAKQAVEDARDRVAAGIGSSPSEVLFTGGGTEADNLALIGTVTKLRGNGNHVVTTAFEHHAVLHSVEWLGRLGFETTVLPVPESGVIEPARVAAAVRPDTIAVSVMAVNNEIGTIQPVREIVGAVRDANPRTLIHTDAVQALPNLPVNVTEWGVDLAAFSAHKLGGPKGVGALFLRAGVPLAPTMHGGGQEKGLRSGTLNVPGIAGFGVAVQIAAKEVHERIERLRPLRDGLLAGIVGIVPDAMLNGDGERRIAANLSVAIPGAEGEVLILLLDQAGIACSTGSACQSGAVDPSHVLLAIGRTKELANGSLRFSLGRSSTQPDVDAVLEALPKVVEQARRAA
ncbi:MAG: aminotransferase class V-fold PLP-dependent enzyme [Actinobacteria bacterium]|nr:aminotransferase class V-fold PLP-dependent enzyme [Actinomycetota bacterium]